MATVPIKDDVPDMAKMPETEDYDFSKEGENLRYWQELWQATAMNAMILLEWVDRLRYRIEELENSVPKS